MRWLYVLLSITALVAFDLGKRFTEPKVALVLARRAWQGQDVEGCFEALKLAAHASPTQAYDVALSFEGDDTQRHQLLERLLKQFPNSGPDLLAAFLQHPEHQHHGYGVGTVAFRACAQADPERAWQGMLSLPGRFIPGFLPAFAEGLTRRDPEEAMKHAEKIASPVFRERFVSDVIQQWSDRDGQGLMTWLRAQPDRAPLAEYVAWDRLKIADASALRDIAALLPKHLPTGSGLLARPMLPEKEDVWMRHTDWLLALSPGEMRARLCTAAAPGLADLDPEAALKLLPEIQDAQVRQRVTTCVAAYRAAAAPQEGLAFANALTDERERIQARNAAFFTWAENDPMAAVRHALESGDPDAQIMLSHAGFQMARNDPEGACRFALEQEKPDKARDERGHSILRTTLQAWVGREPVAARRWVRALPEGAQKDTALAAMASALVHRMPEEALQYAQDIQDATVRKRTLQSCLTSWAYKDVEKPARWLAEAKLDEETRQAIAKWIEPSLKARRSGPSHGAAVYVTDGVVIF